MSETAKIRNIPMWTISKRFKVSYAHRVFNQDLLDSGMTPKCVSLHGHDSTIVYRINASSLHNDMVLDYTLLKKKFFDQNGIFHAEELDHKLLLSTEDPKVKDILLMTGVSSDEADELIQKAKENEYYQFSRNGMRVILFPFVLTAENLSRFLYHQFLKLVNVLAEKYGIKNIDSVEVCFNETDDTEACYSEFEVVVVDD